VDSIETVVTVLPLGKIKLSLYCLTIDPMGHDSKGQFNPKANWAILLRGQY